MRRAAVMAGLALPVFALGLALGACGLTLVGTAEGDGGLAGQPDTAAPVAPPDDDDDDDEPTGDGGDIVLDGGDDAGDDAGLDAGIDATVDAGDDAGVVGVLHAVSSVRLFGYDPSTSTWTRSMSVGPGGAMCPRLEELAEDSKGNVFGVEAQGTGLHRVDFTDPSRPKCQAVLTGAAAGTYPSALAFVPVGTLLPDAEALVGYNEGGDYLSIGPANGSVVPVTKGALAGFSVGDLATVGQRAFVVMTGSSCAANSCVWEVDPSKGTAMGASVGTFPGSGGIRGLAHMRGKLYGFGDRVVYVGDLTNLGAGMLPAPPGGMPTFLGASSSPSAPTL